MSADKEARLLRVIDLLMEQTRDGTLEWQESFGNTYQATLGGQTLVLEKDVPYSSRKLSAMEIMSTVAIGTVGRRRISTATLEIRGKKGEVLERIEEPDQLQGSLDLVSEFQPHKYSRTVTSAVDELYELVVNRKEAIADAAIDNLLGALEERGRVK